MQLLRKKGMLDSARVLFLPVSSISPNPNQPRKVFSQAELEELAGSIRALGLLQPLTVRRRDGGWELVAGERRLRAARLAGLEEDWPWWRTSSGRTWTFGRRPWP